VETQPVAGVADQVDVNFTVKEKPTGAILLGAGLSSSESVVLSGSISQTNIFGTEVHRGQLQRRQGQSTYALSYTDPTTR